MFKRLAIVCFTLILSVAACSQDVDPVNPNPSQDVSGNYDINFSETLVFKLDLGQGIRAAVMPSAGGWADFGLLDGEPLVLDVGTFCSRPEVECPLELFPTQIAVEQLDQEIVLGGHGIIFHDRTEGVEEVRTWRGVVDHNNFERFRIPSDQLFPVVYPNCVPLTDSQLSARFDREYETLNGVSVTWEPGEPISGMAEGKITVGWSAQCAFGDQVPEDATLFVDVTFTGQRMGPFALNDAPEPVEPDAGMEDADASDANDANNVADAATAVEEDAGPTSIDEDAISADVFEGNEDASSPADIE